jgi:putative DNA primase/helicase
MGAAGLTAPSEIIADGEIHRFHTEGDKTRSRNSWYVFYLDDHPAGAFGDHKRAFKQTWKSNGVSNWTPSDLTASRRRQAERERKRSAKRAASREIAKIIWKELPPANSSDPYLTKKGITPHGTRQVLRKRLRELGLKFDPVGRGDRFLVVPVFAVTGSLSSLQFISEDGRKTFLTDGVTKNCLFPIGNFNDSKIIIVAEGLATAASVHAATGSPVAAVFYVENLLPVAKSLHEKFLNHRLIIAADNDESGTGQEQGLAAAEAVGGTLILCPVSF